MRRLKNKYVVGSLLGSVLAFLYELVTDGEIASDAEHHGQHYEPDRGVWLRRSLLGGVAGAFLAFLPSLARAAFRHPVRTLAGLFLISVRTVFKGVDAAERRLSTTSLGESPSLQPGARSTLPLPAAQSGPDWIEYWYA
jgi:hypothetical protein